MYNQTVDASWLTKSHEEILYDILLATGWKQEILKGGKKVLYDPLGAVVYMGTLPQIKEAILDPENAPQYTKNQASLDALLYSLFKDDCFWSESEVLARTIECRLTSKLNEISYSLLIRRVDQTPKDLTGAIALTKTRATLLLCYLNDQKNHG